ncbi:hypothetical protein [Blastopirellula retiformator]|uniref:Uncharacterized protein n=1 Tax=Blastopirellula retiformator TaxID=2527970 RepID=A0A5C5VL06_9BACT|nr:hypothetical protein [Blastopirellula retiformator]TWT38667.1 hypothetical protein Enr8_03600 [Blastopirellula retiformator]
MSEASSAAATARFPTFSANLLLLKMLPWMFSGVTLLLLVIAIGEWMNERPTSAPSVWQAVPISVGITVVAWWTYRRYERHLLRLGREGVEISLCFAVLRSWNLGIFSSILFGRTRYGFIRWEELSSIEARSSIPEYPCRGRFSPALILTGNVWPILNRTSSVGDAPLADALAIQSAWITSSPSRVAAQIEPYLKDPQLRQTLPSLRETDLAAE